jgi:ribonuclease T1
MEPVRPLERCVAAGALALAAMLFAAPLHARSTATALPEVALADLPSEARDTYALIVKGGPFRFDRDGVAFGNRENILPAAPRGYYHEYTVPTPHAKNRGARRIVCGGPRTAPEACYYTGDHYQSFRRIRV